MCKIYIQKQNVIFLPSIWNKIWDNYVFLQILHSMPTFLNWGCRCIAGSLKLVTALCSLWIVKCQTCPPAQVEMWLQPLSLTQKALNMRQESITVCTLMKVASCHSELVLLPAAQFYFDLGMLFLCWVQDTQCFSIISKLAP